MFQVHNIYKIGILMVMTADCSSIYDPMYYRNFTLPSNTTKVNNTHRAPTTRLLRPGSPCTIECTFPRTETRGIYFTSCSKKSVTATWMFRHNTQLTDKHLDNAFEFTGSTYVQTLKFTYQANYSGVYSCFIYYHNYTMSIISETVIVPLGNTHASMMSIMYHVQCTFPKLFPGLVRLHSTGHIIQNETVLLCNNETVVWRYAVTGYQPTFQCSIFATECPFTSHSQLWTSTSGKPGPSIFNVDNCNNYSYPGWITTTAISTLPTMLSTTVPLNTATLTVSNSSNKYTLAALRDSHELHSLWILAAIAAIFLGLWYLRVPQTLMGKVRGYIQPLHIMDAVE
ncbi:membrane protein O20 [Cercopithecine betaherpesvirus 5]|uniref:Membrane protein O20 n=1 Tax=Simian cytomegalovirus (strain Colburn) TaxID=50292 RepID=G8XTK5_SCMVC|nr:membrane protein O20 [Cercopithecine betaherpesvirus 5]AEV80497.1 membrane protein O20 [Cercopithecine betaherpesvirus 5]